LICQLKRHGRKKVFERLESAIRRYVQGKLNGVPWATPPTPATRLSASMPLLHLLALEWLRNKQQLWLFLEACLKRWEAVSDPRGIHHQNVMMHSICETRIALDANDNSVVDPKQKILPQVAVFMQHLGLVQSTESGIDALRQRASRNIRKAK